LIIIDALSVLIITKADEIFPQQVENTKNSTTILLYCSWIVLVIATFTILTSITTFFSWHRNKKNIFKIIQAGNNLKQGNLNIDIEIESDSQADELAAIIKSTAADIQEILLLVGSYSNEAMLKLADLKKKHLKLSKSIKNDNLKDTIDALAKDINSLQEIVNNFKYFKVDYSKDYIVGKD
jgi:hypothetical protein